MSMTGFLDAARRQAATLEQLDHRPWPPPERPWTLGQTWEDLLFAHWRVPAEVIEAQLPAGLALDTFEGDAWLGLAAFRPTAVRLRGLLPMPPLASFLQLNVRTYVTADGMPGVWLFSLDASSAIAVEVARRAYKLPYHRARMSASRRNGRIAYECARAGEPGRAFSGSYRPLDGPPRADGKSALERFLVERYCLYTTDEDGVLHRAHIHHPPWPLQDAQLDLELNTMLPLALPEDPPLCHFSSRLDVVVWSLELVTA